MAYSGIKTVGPTPTLVSASGEDVVSFTVSNLSPGTVVLLYFTAGEVAPDPSSDFRIPLAPLGVADNRTLADMNPGITATRVYASTMGSGSVEIGVSHA